MGLTALIPGLPVQVKGSYNAKHQLVADSVRFKSSDLKNAQDIQAGVTPAEQQIKAEQQQTAVQQAAIREQEQQIEAEQQKTAANKAAIGPVVDCEEPSQIAAAAGGVAPAIILTSPTLEPPEATAS